MNDYRLILRQNGREVSRFVRYSGVPMTLILTIRASVCPSCVTFYLGNDEKVLESRTLSCCGEEEGWFRYEAETTERDAGLYFFHFEADTPYGRCYTIPEENRFSDAFSGEWQLLYVKEKYGGMKPFHGGAIYQIFVDRFAPGGKVPVREDALMLPWGTTPEYTERPGMPLKNNTFFGGTLWGIAEKLDYIRSLGVDCIYLSPIFTAFSNHKYDTGNFLSVDAMFGGDEALRYLLTRCEKSGIVLILDGVFNHVGDDSVYFDSHKKYGKSSEKYRDWFTFYPDGTYDCWWGVTNLPKIRKIPSFCNFICNTVIPHYMAMGVGGWRLDVVDEYSNAFLAQIASSVKTAKPDAYLVGEVWEDASNKIAYDERKRYFCGETLDGVMNYPLRDAVIQFVKTADHTLLRQVLQTQNEHYPLEKQLMQMNVLGTHDTERILTVLGGEPAGDAPGSVLAEKRMTPEEMQTAVTKYKLAYALLAMLPGIPTIYYGDEAGLEGYRDPFNRKTFPWGKQNLALTDFIGKVNRFRKSLPILQTGDTLILDSPPSVFLFERMEKNEKILCAANAGETDYCFDHPLKNALDGVETTYLAAGQASAFYY